MVFDQKLFLSPHHVQRLQSTQVYLFNPKTNTKLFLLNLNIAVEMYSLVAVQDKKVISDSDRLMIFVEFNLTNPRSVLEDGRLSCDRPHPC